jgi:hypothetical protein
LEQPPPAQGQAQGLGWAQAPALWWAQGQRPVAQPLKESAQGTNTHKRTEQQLINSFIHSKREKRRRQEKQEKSRKEVKDKEYRKPSTKLEWS